MVGTAGLEPATSWSRTRRTTKLCYVPMTRLSLAAKESIDFLEPEFKQRHLICFAKPVENAHFGQGLNVGFR